MTGPVKTDPTLALYLLDYRMLGNEQSGRELLAIALGLKAIN